MAIQYWMNYCITFRNRDEYEIALAITGGTGSMIMAPDDAGALFGLGPVTSWPTGDVSQIPIFGYFFPPFGVGQQLGFPGPTGVFLNAHDLTYHVACQPGTPASSWPCPGDGSHDADFTWVCCVTFQGSFSNGDQVPPPAANPIPQRRWIVGFEETAQLEGTTTILGSSVYSRDSSRTIDGIGLCNRGTNSNGMNMDTRLYRPGLNPPTSWERFYVRFRRMGTGTGPRLWKCHGFPSSGAGAFLRWQTDNNVHLVDETAFAVERDKGNAITGVVIDQWYRFDVFLKYATSPAAGVVRVYIDGVFAITYSVSDNNGMGGGQYHITSDIGISNGVGSGDWEIDIDDWINADLPANVDATTLVPNDDNFPIDWFMGSHIKLFKIDPNTGSSVNWTGTRASMNQAISPVTRLTNQLNSTTALARIEAVSDIPALDVAAQDPTFPILGIASVVISAYQSNAGSTDGQLGYKKAGGADVLTTIDQTNTIRAISVAYIPSGLLLPEELSPFSLIHTKSNDANNDIEGAITVTAEELGVFGPEDDPIFELPVERKGFIHNAPYPETAYALLFNPVAAPVYAVGGTYVGNGTFTKVTLPTACHWLHIRATGGVPVAGLKWWSTMLGAHYGTRDRVVPNLRVGFDGTNYFFEVSGQDIDVNQNAITYQYVAFCDPGSRFLLNGAFEHSATATAPANTLVQPTFVPDISFAALEQLDAVSNNEGLSLKGPANTGNAGQGWSGNAQANWGSFIAGVFNSLANLHGTVGQLAYSLWRITEPGCAGTMIQVTTYVGNGAGGTRNINLTPVSGRFPLFVIVFPSNAVGVFRDPSHTGANSSNISTIANVANAITAVAVDQITVGTALNANLINYTVFVICGDTAGMNNGSFTNLFCDLPAGPQNDNPNLPSNEPNVIGDGGLILNGGNPTTLLKDLSGIYTLIPGQRHDTLYDRQTGQPSVDVEIPEPTFKTGYIGG